MKRNTSSPIRPNHRKLKGSVIAPKRSYLLADAIQEFNIELAQGGDSTAKRHVFLGKLKQLLGDQSNVPLDKVNLCSIAEKVYRFERTKAEREDLCRATWGFFGHALRGQRITHAFFQKILLYFWIPEANLPAGIMSLDEIRTALREASTLHAKIGLIFALTMDISALPLNRVTLSDFKALSEGQPRTETSEYGQVMSLVSWLMALPKETGLLVGSVRDYCEFRAVLKRIGFKRLDALRQTRIAYHSALAGPVVKFATSGSISPDTVKKCTVPGLDAWAGYAFHFGITPESCGIRDWPGSLVDHSCAPTNHCCTRTA